jgi:AcrR family transcriptional regulator
LWPAGVDLGGCDGLPGAGAEVLTLSGREKTRAAIQRHPLRLFREQGYDATTVDQIAEAAEVSQTTVFRYFPTKEDVVLTDDYDPLILKALHAQPSERAPVAAIRAALRMVFQHIPPAELAEFRERQMLAIAVPQIRAAVLDALSQTVRLIADAVAERTGRDPEDAPVRALAGAVIGAVIGVMIEVQFHWVKHPELDLFASIDEALAQLEAGLLV